MIIIKVTKYYKGVNKTLDGYIKDTYGTLCQSEIDARKFHCKTEADTFIMEFLSDYEGITKTKYELITIA